MEVLEKWGKKDDSLNFFTNFFQNISEIKTRIEIKQPSKQLKYVFFQNYKSTKKTNVNLKTTEKQCYITKKISPLTTKYNTWNHTTTTETLIDPLSTLFNEKHQKTVSPISAWSWGSWYLSETSKKTEFSSEFLQIFQEPQTIRPLLD